MRVEPTILGEDFFFNTKGKKNSCKQVGWSLVLYKEKLGAHSVIA